MTKKIDENDFAKQRIRQWFKQRGVNFRHAEEICGLKRGFLSAGGVVGSDKLAQICEVYPDIDIYYIVTGKQDPTRFALNEKLQNIANEVNQILIYKELQTDKLNRVLNITIGDHYGD